MTTVNDKIVPFREKTAEVTRVFDAPIRLVWEAWTRQEFLSRWFCPAAIEIAHCEVDFRPGGKFVLGYRLPDGTAFPPATSVFQEIVPLTRIVWTGSFPGSPIEDQIQTTVTFEDLGDKTRINVRQVLQVTPGTEMAAAGMQQGWEETLERLVGYLVFPHKITLVSDIEVRIERSFQAPAQLVFDAFTKPELKSRWYGFETWTTTVAEIDLRPGGPYRWTLRSPEGLDACFKGEYREVVRPGRLVYTEQFLLGDTWSDPLIASADLTESEGLTTLTISMVYTSRAHRDGHLGSGLESGMAEFHRRLDELLATLV
ncbi:MAG: SRPBCC domain-containing protein [Cyanobacteria bacterium REEB65]|nr:SRPBCC domain-containing protein [Cyanobacteria bacterium REEB65]